MTRLLVMGCDDDDDDEYDAEYDSHIIVQELEEI